MNNLQFPKISLGHFPTPLEPMTGLTTQLNGPQIFVKRDDCTGLAMGGNKTRKLEYLMADAIAQKADVIVTTGGIQSNHVRQTAAAACRLGLPCVAVLEEPDFTPDAAFRNNGNLLLDACVNGACPNGSENECRGAVFEVQFKAVRARDAGLPAFECP